MGEYYIKYPDELYHYGVKGMRWGVRHDPERSGNGRSRSGMSTAKKVAIGVGIAAGIAGAAYMGVQVSRAGYNKRAIKAGLRAVKSAGKASKHGKYNLYKESTGHYRVKAGRGAYGAYHNTLDNRINGNVNRVRNYSTNGKIDRRAHLTGHSKRVTKAGAAAYRQDFYSRKAVNSPVTSDYMTNKRNNRRVLESRANAASIQLKSLDSKALNTGGKVARRYVTTPINRLSRQKKVSRNRYIRRIIYSGKW